MHIARDASGTLTVTNVESFIRLLRAFFIAVMLGIWLAPIEADQKIAWSLVCGLFVLALTAVDERSLFVFDTHAAMLRWRKDTPFRHLSGTVPYSAITGLSLERDFSRQGKRGTARRLVILTTNGPIPMTTAFTGVGGAAEETGRALQEYFARAKTRRAVALTS